MLFWFFTIFGIFVMQMLFTNFLSIFGVFPNLFLLATIFFAVRMGPGVGEWSGFVWGMIADVASISILGSQTFLYTLVGYAVGCMHGKIDEDKPAAQMGIVFPMSILYILGLIFFENFFGGATARFYTKVTFFQPLYTTVISPVIFWLLIQWCELFRILNLWPGSREESYPIY